MEENNTLTLQTSSLNVNEKEELLNYIKVYDLTENYNGK